MGPPCATGHSQAGEVGSADDVLKPAALAIATESQVTMREQQGLHVHLSCSLTTQATRDGTTGLLARAASPSHANMQHQAPCRPRSPAAAPPLGPRWVCPTTGGSGAGSCPAARCAPAGGAPCTVWAVADSGRVGRRQACRWGPHQPGVGSGSTVAAYAGLTPSRSNGAHRCASPGVLPACCRRQAEAARRGGGRRRWQGGTRT